MVLCREQRPQELDRGEREGPICQHAEDHRITSHRTRCRRPVVGSVLGQAERFAAVHVQASRAFAQIDLSRAELGKVRDQLHGDVTVLRDKRLQPGDECVVRQPVGGGEDVFVHDLV